MPKCVKRMHLSKMPFDKFSDNDGFVHATGDECLLENGEWCVEYEDDEFEDAPDCEEIWEDDEEE
ncbi:MAG: hypothetical protein ACLTY2_01400 [Coprococcus eutactus]